MMSNLARRLVFSLAVASLGTNAYAGLPVIPGAAGFGIDTLAGRGGKIFRVTNLQASGPGSLEECVAASGPRICVFEVSGVIRRTGHLAVRNPYVTIAGQSAPAPGIMIRGAGLAIRASDVLVQHISVRPGDDVDGPALDSRDALQIDAPEGYAMKNVVVDHCSFSWSVDEVMSVWGKADNVTLSNNIFSEPLNDSLHPKGLHGYAALVGSDAGRVSVVGNLFAHASERNPRSGAGQFVFVNNIVYDYENTGVHLFSNGAATLNSLVGNLFIKGPSSSSRPKSIRLDGVTTTLVEGTKIFLKDNVGDRPDGTSGTGDPWSIVHNQSELSQTVLESMSPPTWPAGLVARATTNGETREYVLGRAGSRPAERTAVDAKVIDDVRKGTGRIVNCVADDGSSRCAANAGGWPDYSQNRRALTLPTDPSGDDNGNGYTNVEEWLHHLAAEVEGRSDVSKPRAPTVEIL